MAKALFVGIQIRTLLVVGSLGPRMHILVSTFWNLSTCVFSHTCTHITLKFQCECCKLQYQEICFSIHPFCFWNKSCCEESLKWFLLFRKMTYIEVVLVLGMVFVPILLKKVATGHRIF
jgi:hypothetical protein